MSTYIISNSWDFDKMKFYQNHQENGIEKIEQINGICTVSYIYNITVNNPENTNTTLIINSDTFNDKFLNMIFFDMSEAINITTLIIGKKAFYACGSLSSFTFPPNLETLVIEDEAFKYCLHLRLNFGECKYLKNLTLGSRVFSDCISLTDIKLPNNIKLQCNDDSFVGSLITSVIIPKTIQTINLIDSYNKPILDAISDIDKKIDALSIKKSCFIC